MYVYSSRNMLPSADIQCTKHLDFTALGRRRRGNQFDTLVPDSFVGCAMDPCDSFVPGVHFVYKSETVSQLFRDRYSPHLRSVQHFLYFEMMTSKLQELICMITLTVVIWYTPTTLAATGFLHPELNFRYQPPEQKMDVGKTTRTTTTTTTTLTVDDTNVSFLFKVKVYPFKRKVLTKLMANNKVISDQTPHFGGPETDVVGRPTSDGDINNGVVAFGVDLGLPGSLGGMGYGHQVPFSIPFETLSISSVRVRTESRHHTANEINDDRNEY